MSRLLILVPVVLATAAPAIGQTAPAAPQKTAQAEPTDPDEKKICKRTVDTGSFIKGKKVCLTRAQWTRVAEDQSDLARRVVGEGTSRPSGN